MLTASGRGFERWKASFRGEARGGGMCVCVLRVCVCLLWLWREVCLFVVVLCVCAGLVWGCSSNGRALA